MATELSDETFEEFTNKGSLVLVDFWAPWCGPCRMVGPVVDKVAEKFDGNLEVGKLDIEEYPIMAAKHEVTGIPHLVLYKDGTPVWDFTGACPETVISKAVEANL
jgi:thioredoxin 1